MIVSMTPTGIRTLIQRGEQKDVEFKTRIPENSRELTLLLSRFVFDGGVILFGVADDGSVVGLSSHDLSRLSIRVRRATENSGFPALFETGSVALDGKIVSFVRIVPTSTLNSGSITDHIYFGKQLIDFLIQLFLFLILFGTSWYLLALYGVRSIGQFNSARAALFGLAITSLFTLIFYGTSFDWTPFKLLVAPFKLIFQPVIDLGKILEIGIGASTSFASMKIKIRPQNSSTAEARNGTDAPPSTGSEDLVNITDPIQSTELLEKGIIEGDPVATAGREGISEQEGAEGENAGSTEIVEDSAKELMANLAKRISAIATRSERRTDVYMILGVAIAFLGMIFWYITFSKVNSLDTLAGILHEVLPRITILLFIELLAGFFLRQYRIGIEDFKYYFEMEQRARWKAIAYLITTENGEEEHIRKFALTLSENVWPSALKKGETTGSLEAMKSEPNITLEALRMFADAAKEAIKREEKK